MKERLAALLSICIIALAACGQAGSISAYKEVIAGLRVTCIGKENVKVLRMR